MNSPRHLKLSLLLLRYGVFIVFAMWTIDKFVNPGHAAAVFKTFYMIDGLSTTAAYVVGALQAALVACFVLGIAKTWTYGAIVLLLTLPITIITLGLFLFIVNAAMFGLVAAMLEDFRVSGLGAALLGAIIVGLTSMLASWFIGPSGRYEVMLVKRER